MFLINSTSIINIFCIKKTIVSIFLKSIVLEIYFVNLIMFDMRFLFLLNYLFANIVLRYEVKNLYHVIFVLSYFYFNIKLTMYNTIKSIYRDNLTIFFICKKTVRIKKEVIITSFLFWYFCIFPSSSIFNNNRSSEKTKIISDFIFQISFIWKMEMIWVIYC